MKKLKRKRATESTKATRFITAINQSTENTHRRLRTLQRPTPGNAGSVGLIGRRYPGPLGRLRVHFGHGDVRGVHWFCQARTPKGQPEDRKKASLIYREPSRSGIATRPNDSSTSGHSFGKLPPIKLEPFAWDVETWARFWEQFESSIDKDPTLSTVNKHVFLRGYLEGEPKMLVDGIAVTASAHEDTKKYFTIATAIRKG